MTMRSTKASTPRIRPLAYIDANNRPIYDSALSSGDNLLEEFLGSARVLSYGATEKAEALITKNLTEAIPSSPSIADTESRGMQLRLREQAVEKACQLLKKCALRDIDEWKSAFLSGSQGTTLSRAKWICQTFDDNYGTPDESPGTKDQKTRDDSKYQVHLDEPSDTELLQSLKRPRKKPKMFKCVFREHNPSRQYGIRFECNKLRELRHLRTHVRHHVRPYYCEECYFNTAEKSDLDKHICDEQNRLRFKQRTARECERNQKLVANCISLQAIKNLLFEPCIEEDCNCSKNISSGGHISDHDSESLELTTDIRKIMNQEKSIPMGHDQPHSQDDDLRNILPVTRDIGEWTDDWLEPTKICGVDNTSRGIQSEDPNLANRGSVAEEAQNSGQTIDPRLTVIEWSDGQPSWVRHIGMGSPSDHAVAKTHRQFTSSLSDTISSLTSLSLDMPPEKRARKCPEFSCPHCSTTCTSQRKLDDHVKAHNNGTLWDKPFIQPQEARARLGFALLGQNGSDCESLCSGPLYRALEDKEYESDMECSKMDTTSVLAGIRSIWA